MKELAAPQTNATQSSKNDAHAHRGLSLKMLLNGSIAYYKRVILFAEHYLRLGDCNKHTTLYLVTAAHNAQMAASGTAPGPTWQQPHVDVLKEWQVHKGDDYCEKKGDIVRLLVCISKACAVECC